MKEATLIPQWEPQAQFAGYYVAQAKGFYVRHGVDMTILRGGPSNPPSKLLTSGKAQFGTMFLATAILERSKGLKLMNIAQFMRGSTVLLVVQKESGITRPEDFDGKKVSLWDKEFSLQPEEFFKKYNVEVTLLPQGFTPDLFLRGGVDAMSAMYYNEYHTLLNTGLDPEDLTVFAMADYGLNFAEDGLYCLESTYRDDPELCHAVAEASIEGWVYAHEHPEETLDIVMERVNAAMLPTNRAHQKWMLERMFENIFPDDNQVPPGPLQSVEFDTVVQSLNRAGMLPRPVSFEEFHVPNR
ncbi:ABC transporter substrate-binding protein [Desulfovibrio inopinatus]|uniref:ABC transporter substrate-binding protein n=1 Tax=Desulfovibrio inopinatus TaxID=102109 RepID=UPI001FE03233|nr:ABC transporter substrate-binding protein [Desulfovibrio inopinatus]